MNKIIFQIAISCLVFWIISPILLYFLGLEFNDKDVEHLFEIIRFWGVPICILLTLFGTIKPNEKRNAMILKTVLTFFASAFAFFIMLMILITGMCNWSNLNVLYTNKENKKIKIIQREYGCGALDSGPPNIKNFKVRELSKYFISAREIDILKIEQTEWLKIK